MKIFKKPIFTGFAPNITKDDLKISLSFLFLPWKWSRLKRGACVTGVESWLRKYFNKKHVFTFDSGRTALHYALKSLGVGEGDEILVQAYTCVVVVNAIKWTGAKPIFVDIGNDFNMDPKDLEKKISNKTKVLIMQHTFGQAADMGGLLKIAKDSNLKVVEDCAHSLGVKYKNQLTGTFGDVGMFSFGSDKVVSCVRGGALITNNQKIAEEIKKYSDRLSATDFIKIIQHILQIPIFYFAKPIYNLKIGKWILAFTKMFNIVNKVVYKSEKYGKPVLFYPTKLANSLACILLGQLKNLDKTNDHRRKIAKIYFKGINNQEVKLPVRSSDDHIFLRFTLLSEKRDILLEKAKKQGIILGKWYDSVIVPKDIHMAETGYKKGDCATAEKLVNLSVNLPTNRGITKKEAKKIITIVNSVK